MTKSTEILELYLKFIRGEEVSKANIAEYFGNKSPRTVQRYISDLNEFFNFNEDTNHLKIEYDRVRNVYFMNKGTSKQFGKEHVLVILKMLISSRGLTKDELQEVVVRLTSGLSDDDKKTIDQTINSELYHYKEVNHEEPLFNKLWALNEIALAGKSLEFNYYNARNQFRVHKIKPLYITFSELYFYLVGVNEKGDTLIYRVDRIEEYKTIPQKIVSNQSIYSQEGELKKRAYFMYGGEWKRVQFEFNNGIIESVLDRFPTAKLIKKDYKNNQFIVEVEVIGNGIVMWLLSQGSRVKVISPQSVKNAYLDEIKKINQYYQ